MAQPLVIADAIGQYYLLMFKNSLFITFYLFVGLISEHQHEMIARLESSLKEQHPYLAYSFLEDAMNFMFGQFWKMVRSNPVDTLRYE